MQHYSSSMCVCVCVYIYINANGKSLQHKLLNTTTAELVYNQENQVMNIKLVK